ncbi:hypothetical protein ABBQ32_002640 [Trebouxia sp. C0010 RCD-2024]
MAETCVVCNNPDAENMLLCDKCNKGYHTACIGLDHVPEEEFWFCGDCIKGTAVPNKTRACSSDVKAAIRALLVTEEEPPKPDSLHHCWLCNEGPKQSKAKPEEFLCHLKAKHQDHELIPDILRYQQIHLLKSEAKARAKARARSEAGEVVQRTNTTGPGASMASGSSTHAARSAKRKNQALPTPAPRKNKVKEVKRKARGRAMIAAAEQAHVEAIPVDVQCAKRHHLHRAPDFRSGGPDPP